MLIVVMDEIKFKIQTLHRKTHTLVNLRLQNNLVSRDVRLRQSVHLTKGRTHQSIFRFRRTLHVLFLAKSWNMYMKSRTLNQSWPDNELGAAVHALDLAAFRPLLDRRQDPFRQSSPGSWMIVTERWLVWKCQRNNFYFYLHPLFTSLVMMSILYSILHWLSGYL